MNKIHIYFMPGMGASSRIFEKINLPKDQFEFHYLEWLIPHPNESLNNYTTRIQEEIKHENPVLIGVSFGGIIVQELAKKISTKKTIIISSVRSHTEFPKRMKWAQKLLLYKFFPTRWVNQIEAVLKKHSNEKAKKRIELFGTYMTIRNSIYLDWAFKSILNWKEPNPNPNVIHVHGDKDEIFPIQYIKNAIVIKGGTHAMILMRYRWFNKHLPTIISKENYE